MQISILSLSLPSDEQVRIAFLPGQGSWSGVGTDALDESAFPKTDPTMNFGWLEDETDATGYERVVVHEFGHALGCVHEHQSPNEKLQWNVPKVYASFPVHLTWVEGRN